MADSRRRKYIPLKEKLAAALSEMEGFRQAWLATQDVEYTNPCKELAKQKQPPSKVIALYDFDHSIFHAHGGSDAWYNLTPKIRKEHREQTRQDLKTIAKGKRIQKKQERHLTALEQKVMGTALRRTAKHWPMKEVGVDLTLAPDGAIKGWYERVDGGPYKYKRKWPSRPFPKRKK